ncbi:hypothetical protein [Photobacterium minamisatsumaniensis]|uniref:hypothetical protein n=1 Tax=Photobacterium minamisatsumaniensis TaxID=2910233 RepID=UPI003D0E5089
MNTIAAGCLVLFSTISTAYAHADEKSDVRWHDDLNVVMAEQKRAVVESLNAKNRYQVVMSLQQSHQQMMNDALISRSEDPIYDTQPRIEQPDTDKIEIASK